MFQAHVSSVSPVLDICYKCFHLDVSKKDLWNWKAHAAASMPPWVTEPPWVTAYAR
jgi:hypothetical protein